MKESKRDESEDDDKSEEGQAKIVNARGRPKGGAKAAVAVNEVVKKKVPSHKKGGDNSSDEDYNQPKLRGKRGRPRKVDGDDDEATPPKPKKIMLVDENGNPIAKRRGRPPKDASAPPKVK